MINHNDIPCKNVRKSDTLEIVDSNLREAGSLISSNRRVVSTCSLRSDIERTIRPTFFFYCNLLNGRGEEIPSKREGGNSDEVRGIAE